MSHTKIEHIYQEYEAYISMVRESVVLNWNVLSDLCPTLRKYCSYEEFECCYTYKMLTDAKGGLYRELTQVLGRSEYAVSLLVLLFSRRFRLIIQFIFFKYKHQFIIHELYSAIILSFLELLEHYAPNYPSPEILFRRTRNKTSSYIRKAAIMHRKKAYTSYVEYKMSQYDGGYDNKPYEIMILQETMGGLARKLDRDEYKALEIRCTTERYERGPKVSECETQERDIPAERRAVRKSRVLLSGLIK